MSDDSADQNTQYGNIEQIKAELFELQKAVADMEAKTEPLQNVTNALNRIDQIGIEMDALVKRVLEMDGRYQTKLGALEQRLDAMDQMGKVGHGIIEHPYKAPKEG